MHQTCPQRLAAKNLLQDSKAAEFWNNVTPHGIGNIQHVYEQVQSWGNIEIQDQMSQWKTNNSLALVRFTYFCKHIFGLSRFSNVT